MYKSALSYLDVHAIYPNEGSINLHESHSKEVELLQFLISSLCGHDPELEKANIFNLVISLCPPYYFVPPLPLDFQTLNGPGFYKGLDFSLKMCIYMTYS